jgi:hypothetical protein
VGLNVIGFFLVLHLQSGGTDYLFSNAFGSSTAGDTPASEPYLNRLRPGSRFSWSAFDTSQGWVDIGGVVNWETATFTMDNRENPTSHVRPFDFLRTVDFTQTDMIAYGCPARIEGNRLVMPALSGCKVVFRGQVDSAGFGDDTYVIRATDETTAALFVPIVPDSGQWTGMGGGVTVDDTGTTAGAQMSRVDTASLRSTASHWISWELSRPSTADTGTRTIFSAPLHRIRRISGSPGTFEVEMLQTGGTWIGLGAQSFAANTAIDVLVNYDAAGPSAELFIDGVSVGSTAIAGGLDGTAGAAPALWSDSQVSYSWYTFRKGARLLAAAEIDDHARFALEWSSEISLEVYVGFDEGFGPVAADLGSDGVDVLLTNLTDANWVSSLGGMPSFAHSRPDATIGRPSMARVTVYHDFLQLATVGFENMPGLGTRRQVRALHMDGSRLGATLDAVPGLVVAVNATTRRMDGFPTDELLASGQIFTIGGGSNAGDHRQQEVLIDPVTDAPASNVGPIIVEEGTSLTTETAFVSVVSTGAWDSNVSLTRSPGGFNLFDGDGALAFEIFQQIIGKLSAFMLRSTEDSGVVLAEAALKRLGPQISTLTETDIRALDLFDIGWQAPGATSALTVINDLAKRTPSTDDGPSVIYRDDTGAWNLKGLLDVPVSADHTFDDRQIKDGKRMTPPKVFAGTRVLYARHYTWDPELSSRQPRGALGDPLAALRVTEWAEIVTGSEPRLRLETHFLKRSDAKLFADAAQNRMDNEVIYSFPLYGPLAEAELQMRPFDAIRITRSSDTFLSSGRIGSLVGVAYNPDDWSAELVVYFVGP